MGFRCPITRAMFRQNEHYYLCSTVSRCPESKGHSVYLDALLVFLFLGRVQLHHSFRNGGVFSI